MIQHVRIDHVTHDTVTEAARIAGLAYDAMLEWIVCDWAQAWRKTQRQHTQHQHDALGVIPGGD
jgi:hypothetical protein